jgi:hypothetical protein
MRDRFHTSASPHHTTAPTSSTSTSSSTIIHRSAVNPNPEPEWSGAHRGLCVYLSRLLLPAWEVRVVTSSAADRSVYKCRLSLATMQVRVLGVCGCVVCMCAVRARWGVWGVSDAVYTHCRSMATGHHTDAHNVLPNPHPQRSWSQSCAPWRPRWAPSWRAASRGATAAPRPAAAGAGPASSWVGGSCFDCVRTAAVDCLSAGETKGA